MTEKKFICGYCGKEYDTPAARANCELSCDRKRIAEEEKAKQDKLKKEKEDRRNQILTARKELSDMEQRYYKDYGEYMYTLREPITRRDIDDLFNKFRWV